MERENSQARGSRARKHTLSPGLVHASLCSHLPQQPPTGQRRVRGAATRKVKGQQTSTVVNFQTSRLPWKSSPFRPAHFLRSGRAGYRLGSICLERLALELGERERWALGGTIFRGVDDQLGTSQEVTEPRFGEVVRRCRGIPEVHGRVWLWRCRAKNE